MPNVIRNTDCTKPYQTLNNSTFLHKFLNVYNPISINRTFMIVAVCESNTLRKNLPPDLFIKILKQF